MVSIAHAAGEAANGGQNAIVQFLPLVAIFVVFYFLLIRPQQKRAKEHQTFLANMKKGDKVVTGGGMYGVITGITDTVVTLEIADKVQVKVSRGSIGGAQGDEKAAALAAQKKIAGG